MSFILRCVILNGNFSITLLSFLEKPSIAIVMIIESVIFINTLKVIFNRLV